MKVREVLRRFALFAAVMLLTAAALMPVRGIADVGGFSGDTDYGSYDSDWGSSWDDDDDWGSRDDDDDYGVIGSVSDSPGGFGVAAVIIIAIVIYSIIKGRSGKGSMRAVNKPRPAGAAPTAQSVLRPISDIRAVDYNFSEAMFGEKISKLYVDMQAAWQAKSFKPMRPYFTEELYSQLARQLKEGFIDCGLTNRIERIAVLDTKIMGWRQDDRNDIIVARLKTRIVDYVVSDADGSIVRGDSSRELFMDYEWTLIRPKGGVTPSDEELNAMECPNCGAPIDINRTAICEYCGTVLVNAEHDWVISQIKGISQRS